MEDELVEDVLHMNFQTRKITAPSTKPRQPRAKPPTKHNAVAAIQSCLDMLEVVDTDSDDDCLVEPDRDGAAAPSSTTLPSTMRTMTFQDIACQAEQR